MKTRIAIASALVLALTLAVSGPAFAATPDAQEIAIRFDARIGDQSLRCGVTYADVGSSRASITLQDFRIYVSNFRLIARDGIEWPIDLLDDGVFQGNGVALLDFEDRSGNCNGNEATHRTVRGTALAGEYVGLVFDLGVPAELNHQDPTLAAPPLNFSALTWPWRYGYKFTTIDLDTGRAPDAAMTAHAASGFSIHLGSVDCGEGSPRTPPAVPCTTPNRPSIRLDVFDASKQRLVLDLGALLAATDVTINHPDSPSGCMSGADDDDCVEIMDRFGLSFRGQPSRGQQFFRVVAAD